MHRAGPARRAAGALYWAGSAPWRVAAAHRPAELGQAAVPASHRVVVLPAEVAAPPVQYPTSQATGHRKYRLTLSAS